MNKIIVGFDLFGTLVSLPEFDPFLWLTSKYPKLEYELPFLENLYLTSTFEKFTLEIQKLCSPNEISQEINYMKNMLLNQINESFMYSDVYEVLSLLRQRSISTFLISNMCEIHSTAIEYHGLSSFFNHIALSWKCEVRKPDYQLFQKTVRAFNLKSNYRILFIGDSINDDMLGAYNAGFEPIYLSRNLNNSKSEVYYPTISNLLDLKKFIR